jgi:hypothetical protein
MRLGSEGGLRPRLDLPRHQLALTTGLTAQLLWFMVEAASLSPPSRASRSVTSDWPDLFTAPILPERPFPVKLNRIVR